MAVSLVETLSSTRAVFPQVRLRRMRQSFWMRNLVAEHHITPHDLILPVFIREETTSSHIKTMPGVKRLTIAELIESAKHAVSLGIPAIALFPYVPLSLKDEHAQEALNPEGLVLRAIRALKKECPDIGIISDVALDAYTSHGHDGIIRDGYVDNDCTLAAITQIALLHAEAGVDIIAPSEMMDGRIAVIRTALDKNGYTKVALLSYAAKYASAFYGPFREALGSAPSLGTADKKTYQMDPANRAEALREVEHDLLEGADMIMIKPGLPYLDVIQEVRQTFNVPTFAYHVSGEYAMLKAASDAGYLDYDKAILETMIAFKRAGCTGIFTYAALEVAELLKG